MIGEVRGEGVCFSIIGIQRLREERKVKGSESYHRNLMR
jgi:hypothetical protein